MTSKMTTLSIEDESHEDASAVTFSNSFPRGGVGNEQSISIRQQPEQHHQQEKQRRLQRQEYRVTKSTIETKGAHIDMTTEPDLLGIVPRAFELWPLFRDLPCVPVSYKNMEEWKKTDSSQEVQRSPTKEGFLYSKLYKTGSSTTSGINLRIARNVATRSATIGSAPMCQARYNHGPWRCPGLRFKDRDKERSFLWTVVRDPTKRAISQFFHIEVSRGGRSPTNENFQSYVMTEDRIFTNYYLEVLSTREKYQYDSKQFVDAPEAVLLAIDIIQEYDFIGVTERMDEVAVLLMMILRLPMADILFLDAKHKGGFDDGGGGKGRACTYIWKSFLTEGMEKFFNSTEWQQKVKLDYAFWLAANRSMDLTIKKVGRDNFERNLIKFKKAQQQARETCMESTIFPCDEGGTYHNRNETDCLWNDSGCGSHCLDQVATDLGLWES